MGLIGPMGPCESLLRQARISVSGISNPPFGRVGSEALRASGEGLCSVVDASTPLPDGSQSLAVDPPRGRVRKEEKPESMCLEFLSGISIRNEGFLASPSGLSYSRQIGG